jgi:hypothetical protein
MQAMKKGDAVVIVGYNSTIASMLVVDDVNSRDMSNPEKVIETSSPWLISPGDCFLVKASSTNDDVTSRVERAIKKKGYYWEIRLETKVPSRTLKRRGLWAKDTLRSVLR